MRRRLAAVLVLGVAAALPGCGGSGGGGPGGGAAAPSATPSPSPPPRQTVQIRNYAYAPQHVTVPVGTTVTWVQDDATLHTVTDTGVFDSGPLSRGQRYSHTFRVSGTYAYHGTIHPGMSGSVTVQ